MTEDDFGHHHYIIWQGDLGFFQNLHKFEYSGYDGVSYQNDLGKFVKNPRRIEIGQYDITKVF